MQMVALFLIKVSNLHTSNSFCCSSVGLLVATHTIFISFLNTHIISVGVCKDLWSLDDLFAFVTIVTPPQWHGPKKPGTISWIQIDQNLGRENGNGYISINDFHLVSFPINSFRHIVSMQRTSLARSLAFKTILWQSKWVSDKTAD